MGYAQATVSNLFDHYDVDRGLRSLNEIRSIVLFDTVIDETTTMLCLPRTIIEKLGLEFNRRQWTRMKGVRSECDVYGMALLAVDGRDARVEVVSVAESDPVTIGVVPNAVLNFAFDGQCHIRGSGSATMRL